ncbi:unnamed protein product [Dicrocoelium dendriticum]|nr:unnamed protein product [Dicrocoelium dendriticum]
MVVRGKAFDSLRLTLDTWSSLSFHADSCESISSGDICTTNHGRYTALNAGSIPHLLTLVEHERSLVRVNALKVLTCLAETPEGRRILLDHLDIIEPHQSDVNAAVAKHARIAVSVITWKP